MIKLHSASVSVLSVALFVGCSSKGTHGVDKPDGAPVVVAPIDAGHHLSEAEAGHAPVDAGSDEPANAGTSYACRGSFGPRESDAGDAGDAGSVQSELDAASLSDTCVVGQTYCYLHLPPPGVIGGSLGQCMSLAACADRPTCACIFPNDLVNCSCSEVDGKVTVACHQV